MSVFSASITHRSFWWQISVLCFVLGLLLAAATFTATQITRAGVRSSNVALSYYDNTMAAEKAQEYEREINKLREHITELENKVAKGDTAATTLNNELQDTKFVAGLTEAVGPGIQITLSDAPVNSPASRDPSVVEKYLIHDKDIYTIVNELKAAGAEAIAVSGQRISAFTAIRCVGPTVLVNSVPIAPPYIIQAVGDPDALLGAANLPGGVLDELNSISPNMARTEKKKKLVLPAFASGTKMRFSRPPDNTPSSENKKESSKDKT